MSNLLLHALETCGNAARCDDVGEEVLLETDPTYHDEESGWTAGLGFCGRAMCSVTSYLCRHWLCRSGDDAYVPSFSDSGHGHGHGHAGAGAGAGAQYADVDTHSSMSISTFGLSSPGRRLHRNHQVLELENCTGLGGCLGGPAHVGSKVDDTPPILNVVLRPRAAAKSSVGTGSGTGSGSGGNGIGSAVQKLRLPSMERVSSSSSSTSNSSSASSSPCASPRLSLHAYAHPFRTSRGLSTGTQLHAISRLAPQAGALELELEQGNTLRPKSMSIVIR